MTKIYDDSVGLLLWVKNQRTAPLLFFGLCSPPKAVVRNWLERGCSTTLLWQYQSSSDVTHDYTDPLQLVESSCLPPTKARPCVVPGWVRTHAPVLVFVLCHLFWRLASPFRHAYIYAHKFLPRLFRVRCTEHHLSVCPTAVWCFGQKPKKIKTKPQLYLLFARVDIGMDDGTTECAVRITARLHTCQRARGYFLRDRIFPPRAYSKYDAKRENCQPGFLHLKRVLQNFDWTATLLERTGTRSRISKNSFLIVSRPTLLRDLLQRVPPNSRIKVYV